MIVKRGRDRFRRIATALAVLGPGLITASADNDAPGIATYSMAGSTFGYSFLWILVWITLGEVFVQEMASRSGAVTGKGLTDLIRERFGLRLTFFVMVGLVIANLGTTAAQFAGVASASEMFGVSRYLAVPLAGFSVWLLVTKGSYRRVERVLLVLSLYAVAYVVSSVVLHPDWGEIVRAAAVPTIHSNRQWVLAALATVGTTITPWAAVYMQASVADKGLSMKEYGLARADVVLGSAVGNVVSGCIIICTAATLYVHGIQANSAQEAAMALAPVAGRWAEVLFGVGLLGASLLAASVLPMATTYAVCEVFGWERGLNRAPDEAKLFYGLYTAIVALSVLMVLIPGLPLFPLMWLSQVANAVLLPVVLVLMLILANDKRLMGEYHNGPWANVIVSVLGVLVVGATVALFLSGSAGA